MRRPSCTVARRVFKMSPQSSDVTAMSKGIYPIRRTQVLLHPLTSKPLGPIALLPTEVLSNIFLCCMEAERCDVLSPTAAPLVLSQVCSSWRKLCFHMPQLWSKLSLSLSVTSSTLPRASPFAPRRSSASSPAMPRRTLHGIANLASLWFERAGSQLLSVSINLSAAHTTNPIDVSTTMIVPFLSNAHSIQHLSIHVTRASQLRQFFISKASFTNLKSLSLVIKHVDIDAATPITIFCDSPCLSRVALDLSGCPPSPSFIRLPWDTIEDFVMTGTSLLPADDFQSILASSPNLRKASFWVQDAHVLHHCSSLPTSGSSTGASAHASTTPITLPKLTHLSISFYGHHEKTASSLLTSFSLPHLRHFHFFSGFITLSSAAIVASSNRLETFVASGVNISAAEFRSFVIQNPSLHSLTLDLRYCKDDDISGVLDVLAAEQPRVLPFLSDLSLWTHDVSPHSAAYLRLIQSRSQNASNKLCLLLNLARQQHGSCCHFSTCANEPSSAGKRLDEILALVESCEKVDGVDLFLRDVKAGEGINENA